MLSATQVPTNPVDFGRYLAKKMQELRPDLGVTIGWDPDSRILLFGLSDLAARSDSQVQDLMMEGLHVLVERRDEFNFGYADPNDPWLRIENPVAYFPPLRNAA